MKKIIHLIIVSVFYLGNLQAQNDTVLKLFRVVYLQNSRKLPMQSSIYNFNDIAIKANRNNYYLKKAAYDIADSIGIEVNNEHKIMAISFLYAYDTAYVHEQRKYKGMISPGKEFSYNSKSKSISVTKWQDAKTTFELVEVIEGDKKKVYSVIFDNDLYYKKYKSYIDLTKTETSLELLNILRG